MTRYAIIISVERYLNFPQTKFAHADSELIHLTLTQRCDYAVQNTLKLILTPEEKKKPSEILNDINSVISGSESGDSILFYFAGHGHYIEGSTYLILPCTVPSAYESTALALDDISKKLRQPQRACFRIFDACHSGIDVRDGSIQPDSQAFTRAITHDASGWVTLAACREDQYSVSDPDIGHGIFTHYICDYISGLKADEPVLPELLKVKTVDKVLEHAKRLGYSQTPVLNASISGNISLAVRRADLPKEKSREEEDDKKTDLFSRISNLRSIDDMFSKDSLEKVLQILVESFKEEFETKNEMQFEISTDSPISADLIPHSMHPSVVNFAKENGFKSQHELVRHVEEHEERLHVILSSLYMPKKHKVVKYYIRQSSDFPKSATILKLKGDSRCVPTIEVLIYVIPLQITTCMLVSSFRQGWFPREDELELICHSYKILKPDFKIDEIRKLASFAVERNLAKASKIVNNRVEQLERELME